MGGVEPYSQLLGDVSKLQRMLAGLQGQRGVPFVLPEALTPTAPPSCSSRPQPTVADNHNAVGVDSSSSVSTSTSTSSRGGAAASGADSLASTPTMPITTSIGGKAIGNSAALSALAAGGCRGALLSFAPRLLPAYLVVADSGESMDGAAALGQVCEEKEGGGCVDVCTQRGGRFHESQNACALCMVCTLCQGVG